MQLRKPPVALRVFDRHGPVTIARVGADGPYLQVTRVKRSGSSEQVSTITPEGRITMRAFVPIEDVDTFVTYCHRGQHDVEVPGAEVRSGVAAFQAGGSVGRLKLAT